MSSIEVSFNLWYPIAAFWSHPFWFWYMTVGVLMLIMVIYFVALTGAKWKDGAPKIHQFFLIVFCYPYWVVRAIVLASKELRFR